MAFRCAQKMSVLRPDRVESTRVEYHGRNRRWFPLKDTVNVSFFSSISFISSLSKNHSPYICPLDGPLCQSGSRRSQHAAG